jgi:hypothetical protein
VKDFETGNRPAFATGKITAAKKRAQRRASLIGGAASRERRLNKKLKLEALHRETENHVPSCRCKACVQLNKYGISPREERTLNGQLYDSKLEMRYAAKLEMLKQAIVWKDRVTDIKRQVGIPLEVNGNLISTYRADFVVTYADGRVEIHETKGLETPEWKIKEKLFRALFPNQTLRVIKR